MTDSKHTIDLDELLGILKVLREEGGNMKIDSDGILSVDGVVHGYVAADTVLEALVRRAVDVADENAT